MHNSIRLPNAFAIFCTRDTTHRRILVLSLPSFHFNGFLHPTLFCVPLALEMLLCVSPSERVPSLSGTQDIPKVHIRPSSSFPNMKTKTRQDMRSRLHLGRPVQCCSCAHREEVKGHYKWLFVSEYMQWRPLGPRLGIGGIEGARAIMARDMNVRL